MARVVVFCISPPTPEGSEQCREGEGRVQEVSEAIASTHHTGTGHLNLPLHRRRDRRDGGAARWGARLLSRTRGEYDFWPKVRFFAQCDATRRVTGVEFTSVVCTEHTKVGSCVLAREIYRSTQSLSSRVGCRVWAAHTQHTVQTFSGTGSGQSLRLYSPFINMCNRSPPC